MEIERARQEFMIDRRYRGLATKTLAAYDWATGKLPRGPWPIARAALRLVIADSGLAPASKATLYRHIRAFSRWCAAEYGVDDPTAGLDPPRVRPVLPRVLTDDEMMRILASTTSHRDLALFALLIDTGLRLGELASLTWSDVRPEGVVVTGKTGPRTVPISPEVRAMLDGLGDGEHLWTGRQGPLTYWGICSLIRRTTGRAGLTAPGRGAHTIRHTFASAFAVAGGPAFALQRLLGHTSMKMTERYVQMTTADIAEHHARYSPITRFGQELPRLSCSRT